MASGFEIAAVDDVLKSVLLKMHSDQSDDEELDVAQFKALLAGVLGATADKLQQSPLLVPQNAVVLNGSTIRKVRWRVCTLWCHCAARQETW